MLQFLIVGLLLITNIKCQICNNPEGCPEKTVKFNEPLRWCTANNNEKEECENMIKVASDLGYDNIACVQEFSKAHCLNVIRKRKADIVSVVNVPYENDLDLVVATTSQNNPVDVTAVEDSTCVYKLYNKPDGGFKGKYRRHSWTCPSKNFIKVVCRNAEATHCNYFNEIVMRSYDPNTANVQELLSDLWRAYKLGDTRSFGDLLFQGYTQAFYTGTDEEDPPSTASIVGFALVAVALLGVLVALAVKKKFLKKPSNAFKL